MSSTPAPDSPTAADGAKKSSSMERTMTRSIFQHSDEQEVGATSSFVTQGKAAPQPLPKDTVSVAPVAKKLGTLLGVFVPCTQNILGAIFFLRLSWIVGIAGVRNALLTVGLCCATTFLTSLSLSAIATNGAIRGGGPYYLISRALGAEFGGSVGLCFFFGTTAAGSM